MASLEREVIVDERPVKFRASAATPRIYRNLCGRDLWADFDKLNKEFNEKGGDGESASTLSIGSLQIFEDMAFTMAKQADESLLDIEEWLDQFSMFSIYTVMPELIQLWLDNAETLQKPKKKQGQPHAK